MNVRRQIIMLVTTVVIIVGTFAWTLASSNRPALGLDLQGGISIVLFPVKGTDTSALDTAVDIIRQRVDGLGIAEPEVQRQGNTIVVDLPGVKEREKAEEQVGQTAELRFRPVLQTFPWDTPLVPESTTTTAPGRDDHDGAAARPRRRRRTRRHDQHDDQGQRRGRAHGADDADRRGPARAGDADRRDRTADGRRPARDRDRRDDRARHRDPASRARRARTCSRRRPRTSRARP